MEKRLIQHLNCDSFVDYWIFKYCGQIISTNIVRGKSWKAYHRNLESIKWQMLSMIRDAKIPNKIEKFSLCAFVNTRHDPDNISYMCKLFIDQCRNASVIENDTKKIQKGLFIIPDQKVEKDCIIFYFIKNN